MGNLPCEQRTGIEVTTPFVKTLIEVYEKELSKYRDLKISKIGLGRKFSYLVTDRGQLGLAFVPPEEPLPTSLFEVKRPFELLGLLWKGAIPSSLALAAANAIFQAFLDENPDFVDFTRDFTSLLRQQCRPSDGIEFVGYVEGIVGKLLREDYEIILFEDNPVHRREAQGAGVKATFAGSYLPVLKGGRCLVTTGSAWLDPRVYISLQEKNYIFAATVGPTSSFHPGVLKKVGINLVGGSYIPKQNRDKVLKLVEAGYGFKGVRRWVEKWIYI